MTEQLTAFFGVEIRNEAHGGVNPSTLASASESLIQAPDDVIEDWCGGERKPLLQEITALAEAKGWEANLEDL